MQLEVEPVPLAHVSIGTALGSSSGVYRSKLSCDDDEDDDDDDTIGPFEIIPSCCNTDHATTLFILSIAISVETGMSKPDNQTSVIPLETCAKIYLISSWMISSVSWSLTNCLDACDKLSMVVKPIIKSHTECYYSALNKSIVLAGCRSGK